MPFSYYRRLSTEQRRIYDASCRLSVVPIEEPGAARERARELEPALASGDVIVVQRAAARLVNAICDALGVTRPEVEVLTKRPRSRTSELHGLYTYEEGKRPVIQVWMRTAANRQVVKYRTFLRTLLHEVLHHLDYAYFKLPDSMHTEGFYQRESSLVRQLLGAQPRTRTSGANKSVPTSTRGTAQPSRRPSAATRAVPPSAAATIQLAITVPTPTPTTPTTPRRSPKPTSSKPAQSPPRQLSLFD